MAAGQRKGRGFGRLKMAGLDVIKGGDVCEFVACGCCAGGLLDGGA